MRLKSILTVAAFFVSAMAISQDCKKDWEDFFENQTETFKSEENSPLTEEDLPKFKALDYYQYDESYCVEARYEQLEGEEPFEMITSTERRPVYKRYAKLYFQINGQEQELTLYQNQKYKDHEEYRNSLFLPFGDETNGIITYGSGRFIDMEIPDTDVVYLDFNQSYNPLCAYNHKYSCPRPPEENMLDIKIEAGVKGVILNN